MINSTQTQLEIPMVMGQPYETLPDDLFIPPNALELCLESFSGPMDLLLYLIKKENINILELDVAEITEQYIQYIELMAPTAPSCASPTMPHRRVAHQMLRSRGKQLPHLLL